MQKRIAIKMATAKVRSGGIGGLIKAVYHHRFSPKTSRLRLQTDYKSKLEAKVGLEIGGPSDIFRQGGIFPVYPIADMIDNCNLSIAIPSGKEALTKVILSILMKKRHLDACTLPRAATCSHLAMPPMTLFSHLIASSTWPTHCRD